MANAASSSVLDKAWAKTRELAAVALFPEMPRRDASVGQVGICIQEHVIQLAVAVPGAGGRVRLTHCLTRPVPRNSDIPLVLSQLLVELELERAECLCVVPPDDYQLLQVEAPEVPDAELRDALRWRIRELIDFPVDESVIDVFDQPAPASLTRAGRPMLSVVVCRRERVARIVGWFSHIQDQLEVIDVADLALRNLLARTPEAETGVALVLPRPGSSLMLICKGETLYLSRRILASLPDAGPVAPAPPDEEGELRMARTGGGGLTFEVVRSLEYFENHFQQPPVSAMYVAPSAAVTDLDALCIELGQDTGIPTQPLEVSVLVDSAVPLGRDVQASCLLAIGTALRQGVTTL